MPAGRLGAIAGPIFVGPLHCGISVRSMKPYRSKRKGKGPPDAATIWELRRRLRDAFRRYRVDRAQCPPTATELRRDVSEVVRAAQNFVKTPSFDLADKLLRRLELDGNTQAAVRKWLRVLPADWIRVKRELRDWYAKHALPGEPTRATLIQIALIDPKNLAPESGRWRDPALFRLVSVLVPLWCEVTGRAAGPLSDNWGKDGRQFFFADWLEEMLRLMGFPAPPRERILDSVRPSGSRRRKKKPPSVKRRKA
jgi:hypothetical protein